jgi:hypothetical protein
MLHRVEALSRKPDGQSASQQAYEIRNSEVQSPFELSLGGVGAMLEGNDTERATLSQGSHANCTA